MSEGLGVALYLLGVATGIYFGWAWTTIWRNYMASLRADE